MGIKIVKILLVGFFYKDLNKYAYAESFLNKFLKLGYVFESFNTGTKRLSFVKINNFLTNILLYLKVKFFKPDLIFL